MNGLGSPSDELGRFLAGPSHSLLPKVARRGGPGNSRPPLQKQQSGLRVRWSRKNTSQYTGPTIGATVPKPVERQMIVLGRPLAIEGEGISVPTVVVGRRKL